LLTSKITASLIFLFVLVAAPRSWVEHTFKNLIYYHEVDKGGHFAAWEQPELFGEELHAAF
jgi:hypothetical protein